ncbi:hypothetical protein MCOR31_007557 [Pyricularia oryzae]|nr:hypothetical protein MCOR31_007557 [Pyricularia oryzae]KAI6390043.1 hypothetical protein MCOR24_010450 [Pyricularia oryzae]
MMSNAPPAAESPGPPVAQQSHNDTKGPSSTSPPSQQLHPQKIQSHVPVHLPPTSNQSPSSQALSPPTKRDLRSWWKRFQANNSKHQETVPESRPHGIFGVPLRQSITYANVAISLLDDDGKSYIYGYVPIVVAKCGVFLKEKATGVEGIFRLSGSEKRIKELKTIFDSPDRYGKGLVWDGYTVHDAANVLRRYLNDLPEPVVPLDRYEAFRDPLRGATLQAVGDAEGPQFVKDFDLPEAISKYQRLITELPPLNRQLLLYLLDLLAVFAAKSDENRMNSQNLAAIFQPGMLSHPNHAMAPEEYRLNQCVIIFLIENQDHFLIGMQGTAADEKTVQEVQKGTPLVVTPVTPGASRKSGVHRSASNASAGAESVARDGQIRRNRSVSSRHSRHSNGAPSPASPAHGSGASGGLARSNTVPSKKSPAIGTGRFHKKGEQSGAPVVPLTPATPTPIPPSPIVVDAGSPMEAIGRNIHSTAAPPSSNSTQTLLTVDHTGLGSKGQDGLLDPTTPDALTPSRERKLQSLFQRSPGSDTESRTPNKLRKKRLVSSQNPSAQSSTASLPHSHAGVSPGVELSNPMEQPPLKPLPEAQQSSPGPLMPSSESASDATPRAQNHSPEANMHYHHVPNNDTSLKPQNSHTQSLHSSFNEGSDIDQVDESAPPVASDQPEPEKDKKRRWRLSRRKEEMGATASPGPPPVPTSPRKVIGTNTHAEASTSSIGSGSRHHRRSFNGEPVDNILTGSTDAQSSHDSASKEGRDESRGLTGWFKNKYREAKENRDERRNKSPPPAQQDSHFSPTNMMVTRGKSLEITRPPVEDKEAPKP